MTLSLIDTLLSIFVSAVAIIAVARNATPAARIAQRARMLSDLGRFANGPEPFPSSFAQRVGARLAALGEWLPMFEASYRNELARLLARAGFRGNRAVSALVGIKVLGGAIMALTSFALSLHIPFVEKLMVLRIILTGGGFMAGMMLPEFALQIHTRRRQAQIASALPDALDLLVICTHAGHSLAVSIVRIADEMRGIAPALSRELEIAAQELRMDSDSTAVLRNLAERVDVASLRALVTTLSQSQRYGTPITQALQVLARSERTQHMRRLEERAAKLSIKITLPMMFFILPTVILIAAGPAALRLISVFNK